MNPRLLIVDVQGFKDISNNFIVSEFALATEEYTQTFLVKPPYPFSNLMPVEKKHVLWIEHNRGTRWNEGFIDYREFKRIMLRFLENKKILVKGMEKIKWIKDISNNCYVIDVSDSDCPNFNELRNKYGGKDETLLNCMFHKKECALKNVIVIKRWCYENNKIF